MAKALRIILKVLNGIITALLILAVILNVYKLSVRAITGESNVTVFGFSSAVVLTGSMSPAIDPDDMIVTKSFPAYCENDIIMYRGNSSTVTHRVTEVTADGYLTKGDANNTPDGEPIPHERVIGKVILIIPGVGSVISFFTTPLGMLILILGTILLAELPFWLRPKTQKEGETDGHEKPAC